MNLVVDITGGKTMPQQAHGLRVVHAWNTQCGSCGYGGEGWSSSPAKRGNPIITRSTESCPGCGVIFTGNYDLYLN